MRGAPGSRSVGCTCSKSGKVASKETGEEKPTATQHLLPRLSSPEVDRPLGRWHRERHACRPQSFATAPRPQPTHRGPQHCPAGSAVSPHTDGRLCGQTRVWSAHVVTVVWSGTGSAVTTGSCRPALRAQLPLAPDGVRVPLVGVAFGCPTPSPGSRVPGFVGGFPYACKHTGDLSLRQPPGCLVRTGQHLFLAPR